MNKYIKMMKTINKQVKIKEIWDKTKMKDS